MRKIEQLEARLQRKNEVMAELTEAHTELKKSWGTLLSLDDARRIVADFVVHDNAVHLHSAIDYVTPKDRLEGRHTEILAARDRKLIEARERRRLLRQAEHGAQQRGACPLHGSTSGTSRCFSVNLDAGMFHCFKCGRSGNALDLWAQAQNQTPYAAAVDLCQRLNIPLPLRPNGHREEETVVPEPATCTMEST